MKSNNTPLAILFSCKRIVEYILPRSSLHIARINWQKRRVVLDLVKRDVKLRYLGSIFGGYWNFIHPLTMIAIFTAVFSQLMKVKLGPGSGADSGNFFSYTIYLCAALLPWNAFMEMVNRGTRVFQENAGLIKKVAFPMEILGPAVIGSAAITFLISFGIYMLVILGTGYGVSWAIVCIPLIFVIQTIFAAGLGMIFSILNVFFRDVEQVMGILFQLWFWLTPIVYFKEFVPERFRYFFYINPFYYITDLYHDVVFNKVWPHWPTLVGIASFSLLVFFIGASFMCRFERDIPDEI